MVDIHEEVQETSSAVSEPQSEIMKQAGDVLKQRPLSYVGTPSLHERALTHQDIEADKAVNDADNDPLLGEVVTVASADMLQSELDQGGSNK